MLKLTAIGALAALSLAAPALAENAEINYPKGSLGFAELVAGDNDGAIRSMKADTNIAHDDPARLLNLGLAYERSGDFPMAQTYYSAVISRTRPTQLVLSNGLVVDSHALAAGGLNRVEGKMAAR